MTVNLCPENAEKFHALRVVLGLKNRKNKPADHDTTMAFLFSFCPLMSDADAYQKGVEKVKMEMKRDA